MDHTSTPLFKQLISDTGFVRWAKGKPVADKTKWDQWKADHPEHATEFDRAVRTVQRLSFKVPAVNDSEIRYLWKQIPAKAERPKQQINLYRLNHYLTKIAAILFLPLLIYVGWDFYSQYSGAGQRNGILVKQSQEITVVAPLGSRTLVHLPDGSKAWLNAGSTLSYPPLFAKNERKVFIKGEAYFTIQKSPVPLIVQNDGPAIKVYGTEFNVNSYPNEDEVTVALAEGKISLQLEGQERFLAPGQVSHFYKSTNELRVKTEDIDQFICWREGKYIFRDTPLSSIMRILQRQYNVDIELTDPNLGNYKYNATFRDEGLEQILQLLQLSAPIKYTYAKSNLSKDGGIGKGKVVIKKDFERIVKP